MYSILPNYYYFPVVSYYNPHYYYNFNCNSLINYSKSYYLYLQMVHFDLMSLFLLLTRGIGLIEERLIMTVMRLILGHLVPRQTG